MIREDFLQQNAFVDLDSYTEYEKQASLLALILKYNDLCSAAIEKGFAEMDDLFSIGARERIGRAKTVPYAESVSVYPEIDKQMAQEIDAIVTGGAAE
jgi:V/A-type H+-transporting ATPase subunit A